METPTDPFPEEIIQSADMSKLSNSLLIVGGVASLCTILGINAGSIRAAMPAVNIWFLVALTLSLSVFAVGLFYKLRRVKITAENVESKVKGWSDAFGLGITKIGSDPTLHFGIRLLVQNVISVSVFRTLEHPQYLTMLVRMTFTEQLPLYMKLAAEDQNDLSRELQLEMARAKIGGAVKLPETVVIERLVPITDSLTESAFMDEIQAMQFSVVLVSAVIDRALKHGQPPSSGDIISAGSQK